MGFSCLSILRNFYPKSTMSETPRRDFLKTAGTALGAAGIGVLSMSSAAAQDGAAKKRKIIGINGSHRAGKTCAQALNVVFEAIKAADPTLETELVELASVKVGFALDSPSEPDGIDALFKQITDPSCVGVVAASPIYCGLPSARMTSLINRMSALRNPVWGLKNKIIGLVAVAGARNGGQETILQAMMNAFVAQQMILAVDGVPTSHWGATLWNQGDSIEADTYGVGTAKNLGTRIAELAKLV